MKPTTLFALLSAATGAAAAPKTSGLCTKSTSIVSAISNPSGSSFCASLLRIARTTVTSTSTVTPKARTVTKTARVTDNTATVTATRTIRSTTRATDVTTIQSTDSTTVTSAAFSPVSVDCISTTDQLQPYTTTISDDDETLIVESADEDEDADRTLVKRAGAPAALKGQSRRRRRAFCSCLSLADETTTHTIKTTLGRQTMTTTSTSTVSARTITRETVTKTVTRTRLRTSTLDPTTSTVTEVIVTPTPETYPGVSYYAFHNDYNYNLNDPGFDATTWNSNAYEQNGIIQEINDEHTQNYPNGGTVCSLPNGDFNDCDQSTFVNQGYFHAVSDGTYKIASDNTIDNGMYVWSGDNAYSDYNNDNEDYEAVRAGGGPFSGGSQSYDLSAGDLVPFTIMAVNGGGPGRAVISVTTPDGTTSGTDGFFIPTCPASNTFSP